MPLTFNVIYTPGSVRYLSFFVWSLLRWSDASFRLVSQESPDLCHIGGVSFQIGYDARPAPYLRRLADLATWGGLGPAVERLRRWRKWRVYRERYRGSPFDEFILNASQRSRRRDPTRSVGTTLMSLRGRESCRTRQAGRPAHPAA